MRLLSWALAAAVASGCILPEYEKDPSGLAGTGGGTQTGGSGGRGGAGGGTQTGGAGGGTQTGGAGGSGGRGGSGGGTQTGGAGGRGGSGGATQTGGAGGAGPVDAGSPPAVDGPAGPAASDAGGTSSTPKDAGGDPCVPACIAALLAPCPAVGACTTESPTPTTANNCYANGVKTFAEVMSTSAGVSGTVRGRRPDGALCYTVDFEGDDDFSVAVYKNPNGGVVATVVSEADGETVVTCDGKDHVLPARCDEEDPNEPTCTPGVCR